MKSSNETMTREEAIEVYNGLINTKIKEAFEFFAPELRESEDERMEKAIVDALLSHCNSINLLSERGYQIEDVKAWLEKQKEQKPICKTEPIVDSLQKEQPEVDLEKEINRYFEPIRAVDIEFEPFTQMTKCARHFYELGLNARKEDKKCFQK